MVQKWMVLRVLLFKKLKVRMVRMAKKIRRGCRIRKIRQARKEALK